MTKPTLIFVPGAWHTAEVFNTVIAKLSSHGYKCIKVTSLAAGHEPAVTDLQPDTENLHRIVLDEVDQGHDVVVVAHSWGGLLAGGSVDGLSKTEREKDGKKGGVVKLAYMCAFVPPEGVSLSMALGGRDPNWVVNVSVSHLSSTHLQSFFTRSSILTARSQQEPWMTWKDPIAGFYHDLPPAEGEYWKSKLLRHSFATVNVAAASAAWKTIPSSYLICEDDRAIPPEIQGLMVKTCQDLGAKMETERIFCSHSPFLAKPDETVGFLRRAAGEEV